MSQAPKQRKSILTAKARKLAEVVRVFNDSLPVGSAVRVYPGARNGRHVDTVTRSTAYVLSGHTAVVFCEGISGCIDVGHVDPRHSA